jgi:hypothetical protein
MGFGVMQGRQGLSQMALFPWAYGSCRSPEGNTPRTGSQPEAPSGGGPNHSPNPSHSVLGPAPRGRSEARGSSTPSALSLSPQLPLADIRCAATWIGEAILVPGVEGVLAALLRLGLGLRVRLGDPTEVHAGVPARAAPHPLTEVRAVRRAAVGQLMPPVGETGSPLVRGRPME